MAAATAPEETDAVATATMPGLGERATVSTTPVTALCHPLSPSATLEPAAAEAERFLDDINLARAGSFTGPIAVAIVVRIASGGSSEALGVPREPIAFPTPSPSGCFPDETELCKRPSLPTTLDAGTHDEASGGAPGAPPPRLPQGQPASVAGVSRDMGAPILTLSPPAGRPINASISPPATAATFSPLHCTPPRGQQGVCVVVDAHG